MSLIQKIKKGLRQNKYVDRAC